jgi:hypothetical protein
MTPTHEYVVPRSMPIIGSPGSTTVVALATGSTARGQRRIRKNKRIPSPKGNCRVGRVLLAMVVVSNVRIKTKARLVRLLLFVLAGG